MEINLITDSLKMECIIHYESLEKKENSFRRDFEKIVEYTNNNNIYIGTYFQIVEDYLNEQYVKKYNDLPNYVKLLDELKDLKNKSDILNFFKRPDVNFNKLKANLQSYFVNFRPILYYFQDENNQRKKLEKNITFYEEYLKEQYMFDIIEEFIESGYSKTRFIFNKGIVFKVFTLYVNKTKSKNKELYARYLEYIEEKKEKAKTEIQNDVRKILACIKENPNEFTFIDFCFLTSYYSDELIKEADKILDNTSKVNKITLKDGSEKMVSDAWLFRSIVSDYKDIKLEYRTIPDIDNALFKEQTSFMIDDKKVELTDEDKKEILVFLTNNNIRICYRTIYELGMMICKRKLLNKQR